MKKLMKGVLTIGCVCAVALGVVGCNASGETAYDIAVKNGFTGTESEWLLSLNGKNGEDGESLDAEALYQAAVKNGYEGSFIDFCKTLDISIPQYNDTVQIAKNTLSAVSIYCGYSVTTSGNGGWFGQGATTSYGSQAGSGVIVELNKEAGSAYIITNYHVVYNVESDQRGILENIWVYPYGAYTDGFSAKDGDTTGNGIKATYVGGAMDYDIAVLKVEGSEYIKNSEVTQAVWGDSEKVRMGEETYVVGNPGGMGIAVTNGVLSVTSEYITIAALDNRDLNGDRQVDGVSYRVMRTSAAINSGNSGGGMFNAKGELIGIVNAKSALSSVDNMGYALPSSQVKAVYDNILAHGGEVRQATLGIIVALRTSKAVLDEDGNVSVQEEFCVQTKAEKGAAAYQLLNEGDVFIAAQIGDGETVTFTRKHQLIELLLTVRMGDTVHFTLRDTSGVVQVVDITFGETNFTTYK